MSDCKSDLREFESHRGLYDKKHRSIFELFDHHVFVLGDVSTNRILVSIGL